MQQIYKRTPMPKCDFNKFVLQLYWNHTSTWVFSCRFAAYFQKTFLRTPMEGCFSNSSLPSVSRGSVKMIEIKPSLKLVSAVFYQIFIFHQMIALQKLWKMSFISSKKLFSLSRYSNFCISVFSSFSPCRPLL